MEHRRARVGVLWMTMDLQTQIDEGQETSRKEIPEFSNVLRNGFIDIRISTLNVVLSTRLRICRGGTPCVTWYRTFG
jgi:hypothetical protein